MPLCREWGGASHFSYTRGTSAPYNPQHMPLSVLCLSTNRPKIVVCCIVNFQLKEEILYKRFVSRANCGMAAQTSNCSRIHQHSHCSSAAFSPKIRTAEGSLSVPRNPQWQNGTFEALGRPATILSPLNHPAARSAQLVVCPRTTTVKLTVWHWLVRNVAQQDLHPSEHVCKPLQQSRDGSWIQHSLQHLAEVKGN